MLSKLKVLFLKFTFLKFNIDSYTDFIVRADELDDLDSEEGSSASSEVPKEYVHTLTQANFSEFVKKGRSIVEFYAPWCGHCKQLAPQYEEAAKILETEKKSKTRLGKVDATVESSLAQEYSVDGYPTLFYFENGSKTQYEGPRDANGIVDYVLGREVDPIKICTEEEWEKEVSSPSSDSDYLIRIKAAKSSGKVSALRKSLKVYFNEKIPSKTFFTCLTPITKEQEKSGNYELKLIRTDAYTNREQSFSNYKKNAIYNYSNVLGFLNKAIFDSGVSKFNGMVMSGYMNKAVPNKEYGVYLAAPGGDLISDSSEDKEKWIKKLHTLAEDSEKKDSKFKKLSFGIWEGSEHLRKDLGNFAGNTTETLLIALSTINNKRYILKKPSLDNINEWLLKLSKNEVKPDYKTEFIPDDKLYDPVDNVRQLTGATFEQVAFDPKLDVFVMFYAEWCGHCKALKPHWKEMAAKIKKLPKNLDKKVVIAKMDATKNECSIEVQGFPKLYLFPAVRNSEKKMKEFTGSKREPTYLLDFLSDNAIHLDGIDLQNADVKMEKLSGNAIIERDLKRKKPKKKEEL